MWMPLAHWKRGAITLSLALALVALAVQPTAGQTWIGTIELPAQPRAFTAEPIWLAGCIPSEGPPAAGIGLVWAENQDGWLPVWELQLVATESLVPASVRMPVGPGPRPHTKRLTLTTALPRWGHRYDSTLSFHVPTGAVSVLVVDSPTRERVYAGEVRLQPLSDDEHVVGSACQLSTDTGIAAHMSVVPDYIPRGLTWGVVEAYRESGGLVPLTRLERNAVNPAGVHVAALEIPSGSEVRIQLQSEGMDEPLELYRGTTTGFFPFRTDLLPSGRVDVVFDYISNGTARFTESRSISVGSVSLSLNISDPTRRSAGNIGEVLLEADGKTPGFPLEVQARLVRLLWDPVTGRYQEAAPQEVTLLAERLDLPAGELRLPLTLPQAILAQQGLWRIELTAHGGKKGLEVRATSDPTYLALYPQPHIEAGAPFTIAVLPDTQYYSYVSERGGHPDIFLRQTHWLAEAAAERNIAFAVHLGDITDHNREDEWLVSKRSIGVLDGVVPYALAVGNHDYGPPGTRRTGLNTHFPVQKYQGLPTFGGTFAPGQLENSYHTFRAAEMDFLVVVLEFWPRDEVLEWANRVVASHPHHKVIIVTHTYTGSDGRRRSGGYDYSVGRGSSAALNTGAEMWEEFIRKHPNILLVLSGHVPHSAVPRDIGTGDHGNKVYELLMDYQFDPNGGNGWLGLLHFPATRDRIEVTVYSPWKDEWKEDAKGGFYVPFTIDLAQGVYRPVTH